MVTQAERCGHASDKCKNLKTLIPKNNSRTLPTVSEPNEEIQMDFVGPIPHENSTLNNYRIVTVYRISKLSNAEIYTNCDSNTAIEYLES